MQPPIAALDGRGGMYLHRLIIALATCATASSSAAAECPQRADLATGIRATYADGGTADYRALGEGLVEIRTAPAEAGGLALLYTSRNGLYDLSVAALTAAGPDPDRSLHYDYSVDPEALPIPTEGEVWLGTVTTSFPDGDTLDETAIYVFGQADPARQLGGCSFRTVAVKASFIDPEEDWVALDMIWFDDLGLAVATGQTRSDTDGPVGRALVGLGPIAP